MDKSHLCHLMCRDKDDLLFVHITKITTKITKIPTKKKKIPTKITTNITKITKMPTRIKKISTKIKEIPTKITNILSTWVEITLCVAGRTTVFSGLTKKNGSVNIFSIKLIL